MKKIFIDGGARVGETIEALLDKREDLKGCDAYLFECNSDHKATLEEIAKTNKNYNFIVRDEAIWKENGDWVIVCDTDEFLYHPRLLEKLEYYKENRITVPKVNGHDMVSESFPEYDGEFITKKIKTGSEVYPPFCKNIIFNPKIDVNFGIGAHSFQSNNTVYSNSPELKLLHYKFLGKDYVESIYKARAERLSEFNKQNKLGEHYLNLPFEYMDKLLNENIQVI